MRNQYQLCAFAGRGHGGDPVDWDPGAEESATDLNGEFWGRVMHAFERFSVAHEKLTVFMTWDLFELPRYGEDVVAVVFGDESGSPPAYADRVRAVFKIHGIAPARERPLTELSNLAFWSHIRTARNASRVAVGWARGRQPLSGRRIPNMFEVPTGYGNQIEKAVVPLGERSCDVYFAGSVQNQSYSRWSPRYYASPPKELARRAMFEAVTRFEREHAEYRVKLGSTTSYRVSVAASAREYSDALMDSRICLAPRGTTVETFRLFEGLRYGCVVFSDPLPRRWYTAGAPVVEVTDWKRVDEQLLDVLGDEALLMEMHERALRFWNEIASEECVGRFMAERAL